MFSPLRGTMDLIGLDVGRNTHGHRGTTWIGLDQSSSGLGWNGFSKLTHVQLWHSSRALLTDGKAISITT